MVNGLNEMRGGCFCVFGGFRGRVSDKRYLYEVRGPFVRPGRTVFPHALEPQVPRLFVVHPTLLPMK